MITRIVLFKWEGKKKRETTTETPLWAATIYIIVKNCETPCNARRRDHSITHCSESGDDRWPIRSRLAYSPFWTAVSHRLNLSPIRFCSVLATDWFLPELIAFQRGAYSTRLFLLHRFCFHCLKELVSMQILWFKGTAGRLSADIEIRKATKSTTHTYYTLFRSSLKTIHSFNAVLIILIE